MTPEDVDRLVAVANLPRIAEATATLDEKQRRSLSKHSADLMRLLKRLDSTWDHDKKKKLQAKVRERLGQHFDKKIFPEVRSLLVAAELMCLAVCPFSVTRPLDAWVRSFCTNEESDPPLKVLSDRRPDWVKEWIIARCGTEFTEIGWNQVRELITRGVSEKPDDDGYVRLFAEGLFQSWRDAQTLADYLIANPDLIQDEVWRLFRVETSAFLSEDWGPDWTGALKLLTEQGHVDRGQLLDASIDGLTSGLREHVLGGIARFHRTLEPTGPELAERQKLYLDLLSSPSSRIVSFGIDMLKLVEKAGCLDGKIFLQSVAAVFDAPTKGPAKTAMSMLKRVVKKESALAPTACDALVPALRHPNVDVQSGAVDLLDAWQKHITPQCAGEIEAVTQELNATLVPRVTALFKSLGLDSPADDLAAVAEPSISIAALKARADELDQKSAARWEVREAIAAAENGQMPAPLNFNVMDIEVCRLAEPVEPIRNFDQLFDAVAHVIEVVDHGMEIERILDGMCRLLDQRPSDFAERAAPLIHRMGLPGSGVLRGFGEAYGAVLGRRVLRPWLGCEMTRANWSDGEEPTLNWLLDRCMEIGAWIEAGVPRPMLAMPTHTGGWIDPRAFVDRLRQLQALKLEPGSHDLAQALLRLTPDRREDALASAEDIAGPVGSLVRWVLGGTPADEKDLAEFPPRICLAAARSRSPFADVKAFGTQGSDLQGPDGLEAATYDWHAYRREYVDSYTKKKYYSSNLKIKVKPTPVPACDLIPLDLHAKSTRQYSDMLPHRWLRQWVMMIWPANPDPMLRRALRNVVWRIDMQPSAFDPSDGFFEPLLEPGRPWSEVMRLGLWVGLLTQDKDLKQVCIDALIDAVEDGRVHPDTLGQTLAKLAQGGWVKLNRLASSLDEVARVSTLHSATVAVMLANLLPALSPMPRDAYHILALMLELNTRFGLTVDQASMDVLQGITGSGKAAKLAKAIVQLSPESTSDFWRHACLASAQLRLEQATG